MAKRNIVWARTAELQLVGILDYWVKRNKSANYSKKLLRLVTERTLLIADNPYIYKSTDFKDVRVAPLGNFSIYYKVTDKEIIITAFWDNRQDPKKLLEILQKSK